MGLKAIYPKPKLSRSECVSEKYPYLLRGAGYQKTKPCVGTDITLAYAGTEARFCVSDGDNGLVQSLGLSRRSRIETLCSVLGSL
jgi:hypothetical protein